MNVTSVDIRQKLLDNGFSGINIGSEPDTLDDTLTIYDLESEPPNPKFLIDEPGIQIRSRSQSYEASYDNLLQARDFLLGIPIFVQGGTTYIGVMVTTDIIALQRDEKERIPMVATFRIVRLPATGVNRTPL